MSESGRNNSYASILAVGTNLPDTKQKYTTNENYSVRGALNKGDCHPYLLVSGCCSDEFRLGNTLELALRAAALYVMYCTFSV